MLLSKENLLSLIFERNRSIQDENDMFILAELDLSKKQIETIDAKTFKGFHELAQLDLSWNQIDSIKEKTFACLTNLTKLYLWGNHIRSINEKTFNGLSNLKELYLSSNKIQIIYDRTFSSLNNLNELDLSSNEIETINEKSFSGLSSLTFLDLSQNNLHTIDENAFSNLVKLQELNLRSTKMGSFNFKLISFLKDMTSNGKTVQLDFDLYFATGMFNIASIFPRRINDLTEAISSLNTYDVNPDLNIDINENERFKNILDDEKKFIGNGSYGSKVYEGVRVGFETVKLAIKKVPNDAFTYQAHGEINLLIQTFKEKQHENVIRYFYSEERDQFIYIVLDLYDFNLSEFMKLKKLSRAFNPFDILEQATKGLNYLHSINIVHRNIKPNNVLVKSLNSGEQMRIVLTDFGLVKLINRCNSTLANISQDTLGYIAPELMDDDDFVNYKHVSKSLDVFPLGCIFYFILSSDNSHPFGEIVFRQSNIKKNQFNLSKIDENKIPCSVLLIQKMISNNPEYRPTTEQILINPIFWSSEMKAHFLTKTSEYADSLSQTDPILIELERSSLKVFKDNWFEHICVNLKEELMYHGHKYNGHSIISLLNLITYCNNNINQFKNESLKTAFGSVDNLVNYFDSKFPRLIQHVHNVVERLSKHQKFKSFYKMSISN